MRAFVLLPCVFLFLSPACRTPEDRTEAKAAAPSVGSATTPHAEGGASAGEGGGAQAAKVAAGEEAGDEAKAPTVIPPPMKGPAPRNTFHFDPEAPMEGQPVALKAGPITFRNGCEGIESVAVHVNGRRIEVTWTPKAVPPDRICTMALHDDWVEAQLEGLSAGTYTVAVNEVGEATLTVAPRAEGEAE